MDVRSVTATALAPPDTSRPAPSVVTASTGNASRGLFFRQRPSVLKDAATNGCDLPMKHETWFSLVTRRVGTHARAL